MTIEEQRCLEARDLLQIHFDAYTKVKPYADRHQHPHPTDTRGWSQLLVSALTGIKGCARKKGPDLEDGSDVKGANCWDAIDTPRFNGCIKAGTKALTANSMQSLDASPYLFFVMWDNSETSNQKRCRIWVVRTQHDKEFRQVANKWYSQRSTGGITSDNFQLHPPRNRDTNIFRNNCGTLNYPLLFEARLVNDTMTIVIFNAQVLTQGECTSL